MESTSVKIFRNVSMKAELAGILQQQLMFQSLPIALFEVSFLLIKTTMIVAFVCENVFFLQQCHAHAHTRKRLRYIRKCMAYICLPKNYHHHHIAKMCAFEEHMLR